MKKKNLKQEFANFCISGHIDGPAKLFLPKSKKLYQHTIILLKKTFSLNFLFICLFIQILMQLEMFSRFFRFILMTIIKIVNSKLQSLNFLMSYFPMTLDHLHKFTCEFFSFIQNYLSV